MAKEISSILFESIDKAGIITLIDAAKIFAILEGKNLSKNSTVRDLKHYYNKIYTYFKQKKIQSDKYKKFVISQKDLVLYLDKLIRSKKIELHKEINIEAINNIFSLYTDTQISIDDLKLNNGIKKDTLEEQNKELRQEIKRLKTMNRDAELEARGYKLLCLQLDNELKQGGDVNEGINKGSIIY